MRLNVGILIFEGVEVLDFAGPFEVFAVADELNNYELFNVFTVADSKANVKTVNGLTVVPDFDFNSEPPIDVLIIPGGGGTRQACEDVKYLKWIDHRMKSARKTLCICSGARFLAKMGLLENLEYCTHHEVYDHIKEIEPKGLPRPDLRFRSCGDTTTTAGVSAGIDGSFHLLELLTNKTICEGTATYMDYQVRDEHGSVVLFTG